MRYTVAVITRRWFAIVRVVTLVLLTMAAADLFVPNLCGAEKVTAQTSPAAGDQDDCFCCCAHTDRTPLVFVVESSRLPVIVEASPTGTLAAGVPRSLYHPPLQA